MSHISFEMPKQPISIEDFNAMWKEYKRRKYAHLKLHAVTAFSIEKTITKKLVEDSIDENGIPFRKIKIEKGRTVADINGLNKAIVAWLQLFTNPIKAEITNTKGHYDGRIKKWLPNKDRGRADITAQYRDFELCIETKQRYEKQLKSQIQFEQIAQMQSFRKYVIVRSWIDFQEKMIALFSEK